MQASREIVAPESALSVVGLLRLEAKEVVDQDTYRAGDLKREFGVTNRALRAYEAQGFLQPARQGIRRLYSRFDHKRLRLLVLAQVLGFTLLEAVEIIDVYVGS